MLPQCSIAEEKQDEEEPEEEEKQPAPKAQGGFFGRTQQVKAQPQVLLLPLPVSRLLHSLVY